MLKEEYRESLTSRLNAIDAKIKNARRDLKIGSPREKVESAGGLSILEGRRATLQSRLDKLQTAPDGVWEDVKSEIERDLADISDAIERLIVKN